jgi:UDP-N-acetylglucosamine 4,6-dehydratase/5-epimerase
MSRLVSDNGAAADVARDELDGKTILVTGATGSFGKAFIKRILEYAQPTSIRAYSRDELKQHELGLELSGAPLRFTIGDVRDLERLKRAMRGVDVVIHAAAMKQVPICEYNPFEAVQTNVIGSENVVSAAIDNDVPKTLTISTDKAVNPVNLYGATKLCAEKITIQGNSYAGDSPSRFSCVRYGNVVGSRGSVLPLFKQQALEGELTVTDDSMTRFWITLPQAVDFVINSLGRMKGGEVFVPQIPSMRVGDIAEAIAPDVPRRTIGIRPGEKLHEVLITEDESRHAGAFDGYFAIYPSFPFWGPDGYPKGEALEPGFRYSSDKNDIWLDADAIRGMSEITVQTSDVEPRVPLPAPE